MSPNPFFFDLEKEELTQIVRGLGQPDFRATQIWNHFYTNLGASPLDISTLPKSLRNNLSEKLDFSHLQMVDRLVSSDGETVKTLFRLPDRNMIETVLMHYDVRDTLCISSQSGCGMGCVFCATGQMGLKRNLTSGEIIEQVLYYARELRAIGKSITNIVIMGMGEPFQNYDAVFAAINGLNSPDGLNLGARRFTISTVGLVPMIQRFTQEKRQVNLAISLHAANNKLRSSLLPINKRYPLESLIQACREYITKTNRRITFEWALIQDVNDTLEHAEELSHLVKGLLCHVNIIPLNPTAKFNGQATTHERAGIFKQTLEQKGITCTIRLRRGIDIQAGCGQLASRHIMEA